MVYGTHCGAVPDFSVPGCKHDSRGMTEGRNPIHLCLFLAGGGRQGARGVLWGPIGVRISVVFADMVRFWFWFVSKCSLYKFYNNPAPVIRSMQFHYCTVSNPGTGADDAFCFEALRVEKRHMAFTQPTGDSRWCAPFSNLFSPLIF